MIKKGFLQGVVTFVLLLTIAFHVSAQQGRINGIQSRLMAITPEIPALEDKIDISVSDVSIQEFIRGMGKNSSINIHVDPALKVRITANYSQVRVTDILVFLCKEYNLDLNITGTIISIVPFAEPVVEKPKPVRKDPKVEYLKDEDKLTLDLSNDSLVYVTRKITDLTQRNIIVSPEITNMVISGYIKNTAFDAALEKIMYANKLTVRRTKDNFYMVEKIDTKASGTLESSRRGSGAAYAEGDNDNRLIFMFNTPTQFSLQCNSIPFEKILKTVSDTLKINYILLDKIEGEGQLSLNNVDYEKFLKNIFNGNQYGFKYVDGNYLIGKQDNPLLKTSKLIKLQYRTVDKVLEIIPAEVLGNMIVKEFPEQNSFVVTGNALQLEKLESFIQEVDRVVPLILIEILIVEVSKTKAVSVGLSAGLKSPSGTPNKSISPEFNYDVNPTTINNVLGKINSIGWINFGKVGTNFYLNLKALEEDNKLVIRSTPKLATLNGHEANMSSGEKKFYKEVRNDLIGTQNPTISNSYTWTPIEANLVVKIKPIVSGNDHITLDISVEQTQFTKQGADGAPPESVTRKFQSLIRMKDQEMVLLGGLDKYSTSNSSKGLPLIARIPVLKWIFGNNSRSKTDSKLSLFIQPTIIY